VKNQPYYFEIKDVVTQFVAAFDDVVIDRYNRGRDVVDKIQVRYLYAPKQRVVHDLINKAQHITLPAVAISIARVSRDENRVFNKLIGLYDSVQPGSTTEFLPPPVPINIDINMSIITKFQTDMDQILSNFMPYANPYIVISWPVPSKLTNQVTEIRSEVLWDGTVSLTYPEDLDATTSYRVTADTTFTIKGWVFPYATQSQLSAANIFTITTNFTPVSGFDYI